MATREQLEIHRKAIDVQIAAMRGMQRRIDELENSIELTEWATNISVYVCDTVVIDGPIMGTLRESTLDILKQQLRVTKEHLAAYEATNETFIEDAF